MCTELDRVVPPYAFVPRHWKYRRIFCKTLVPFLPLHDHLGREENEKGSERIRKWINAIESDHFHACSTSFHSHPPISSFLSFPFYSQWTILRTKRRSKRMERLSTVGYVSRDVIMLTRWSRKRARFCRAITRSERERERRRKWWTVESQLIRGSVVFRAGWNGCWG